MTADRVAEHDRIRRIAGLLRCADRPVRILRTLAWPLDVRERFLASGARELPQVSYPRADFAASREILAAVRRELRDDGSPIDAWLSRQADALETGADMLIGKTIESAGLPDGDVTVLTLHHAGKVISNPRSSRELFPEDRLFCFGRIEVMKELELPRLCGALHRRGYAEFGTMLS